jgi:hypothetical protein
MLQNLDVVLDKLRGTGRYTRLIKRIEQSESNNASLVFEALFAYSFEVKELALEYERNVNRENNTSVDFVHEDKVRDEFCFELVSPEMSEELKKEFYKPTEKESIETYGVDLSTNHPNQFLRPEALTLRLQEKLGEKLDKFPDDLESSFSLIVINCREFHFGDFDAEDCRIVMYGKPQNPCFTEYWEGHRIEGLLEESNQRNRAPDFRKRVTAVVFVPQVPYSAVDGTHNLFDAAFIVLNHHRSTSHKQRFIAAFSNLVPFRKVRWIGPATTKVAPS